MKSNNSISRNQIALAGEFAVLSQLALRGFDANMTLGNTKSVDILLSHPETGKMNRLEVKTHYNNKSYLSKDFGHIEAKWRMHKKHETTNDKDLFYCFVSIEENTRTFKFYIIPNKVVSEFVQKSHTYWLNIDSKRADSDVRSFMLGKKDKIYKTEMLLPLLEEYKDKWEVLK